MTDNPYHPSKSIRAAGTTPVTIHWTPVFVGFAIGLIGGCIFAAVWGLVGFAVYLSVGSTADTFYKSPVATTLGWCVGIVPFAVGLAYVCRAIEDSRIINCLVVATLSVATSIPFIFFDEDPFDWTIAIYYLIEFVFAGAMGAAWATWAARITSAKKK